MNCDELTFESAYWLEQHGVELDWTFLIQSFGRKGQLMGYKHFFDKAGMKIDLSTFMMVELLFDNYFHIIEFLRRKLFNVHTVKSLSGKSEMVD